MALIVCSFFAKIFQEGENLLCVFCSAQIQNTIDTIRTNIANLKEETYINP